MKIFYILPHCSTGGMPQYALKQVQAFEKEADITVFEVENVSDTFIVQRKQFKNLVQLHGDKQLLLKHIKEQKPDVIHFQEVPESFIPRDVLTKIYDNKRSYYILVTAHSNSIGRDKFSFIPDRLVTVSNWQKAKFEKEFPDTTVDIWEYPIEDLKVSYNEKIAARIKIMGKDYDWLLEQWNTRNNLGTSGGLSYTPFGRPIGQEQPKKHILNVGLFTPGKNQGELFEIARKNPDNNYHFVGNQAPNFEHYWRPLMQNKPNNCFIWGERDDVGLFYKACDEFYFTSKWELYPICIREALSYGIPIKMHKLPEYGNDYDNNDLITYV